MNQGKFTCWCTVAILVRTPSAVVWWGAARVRWSILSIAGWFLRQIFPWHCVLLNFSSFSQASREIRPSRGRLWPCSWVWLPVHYRLPCGWTTGTWRGGILPLSTATSAIQHWFNSRRSLGFSWHLSWFSLIIFTSERGVVTSFCFARRSRVSCWPQSIRLHGAWCGSYRSCRGSTWTLWYLNRRMSRAIITWWWSARQAFCRFLLKKGERDGERTKDYVGFAHC